MTRLSHLFVQTSLGSVKYKYPGENSRAPHTLPPRPDRVAHSALLRQQLTTAQAAKATQQGAAAANYESDFTILEFRSEPNFELKLESLERKADKFELVNARIENGVMIATVRVPDAKVAKFVTLLDQYDSPPTPPANPRNQPLIESITAIQLATIPSFWTDLVHPLPATNQAIWWEVWLSGDGMSAVVEEFQGEARRVGMDVGQRVIQFPERVVLVAFGTIEQFARIRGLFAYLAELRKAIEVPTAYINLGAKDQGEVVSEALTRVRPPSDSAVAVCILDTGVNREHELLALALNKEHTLKVNPTWNAADSNGHGTGMAGIALYGCLTELFQGAGEIKLNHRLESVKILPDHGSNEPENYGALTSEAVALAESISPTRKRVICMAVSAGSCDEGDPSSWSAEIDQVTSGVHDGERRLFVIAAGNLRKALNREDYPNENHLAGIEDPSQSWNAITVGAYTDKAHISSAEFATQLPVAGKGLLCPTSRTTLPWEMTDWPLKPDIVLEGGNTASEASGGAAAFIEDLALLTTRVAETGVQFTHFCETSAATALAARMAAIIQANYEGAWPEAVRALLIHSAEWTPEMLQEFPFENRLCRLKCYGYGVPNLDKALWCGNNVVTMVIQSVLQPYRMEDSRYVTNEMHFHKLPWPTEVLQSLGDTPVTMKLTLSYFIEPSPGRRGWTSKHGYQSFGLRFDVKRPNETEKAFKARLNRLYWENDTRPSLIDDSRTWGLQDNWRTRGSIHSDRWSGTAAQLAASGEIAIIPVVGWWRERPHLERWSNLARYALVVTIETPKQDIDLYSPIATLVAAEEQAIIDSFDQEIEIDTDTV